MTVLERYPIENEALANYDFTDISTGVGTIIYYAGEHGGISGAYILSRNTFYSDRLEVLRTSFGDSTHQLASDIDFDLSPFVLPQTIKGKAIINIPFGHKTTTNLTLNSYINCILKKVDSSNAETNIIQRSGAIMLFAYSAGGGTKTDMATISLEIPETFYKVGETLRITFEQWGWADTNNAADYFFGCDPKNRTSIQNQTDRVAWGTAVTNLVCEIPFKRII